MINEWFMFALANSKQRNIQLVRFQRNSRSTSLKSNFRRLFDWALMLVCCGLIVLVIVSLDNQAAQRLQGTATVVDGDSLVLAGAKLRLEGIDAPEYRQVCRVGSKDYACGKQAREFLTQMISKRVVQCEGWQRDKYARLLVRCAVAAQELNRAMVTAGWAVSYGDYLQEETAARQAKRGVWQGPFERPSQWRKMRGDLTEVPHDIWLKIVSYVKSIFENGM